MRKRITKGEAARLLGITKTQIRFYEKKGLIKPLIDENGYAMYNFSIINELEVILFLRDMDTSISEIKRILHNQDNYNYLDILENAYDDITKEMKRLSNKKKEIKRKIDLYHKSSLNEFTTDYYKKRIIHISEESLDNLYIKDAYDLSVKYGIDFNDFNNELCRIYKDETTYNGLLNPTKQKIPKSLFEINMPEGEYFSYTFCYESYQTFKDHKQLFLRTCEEQHLVFDDFLLFIEHFAKTYYDKGKSIATFQKRILSIDDTSLVLKQL